MAPVAWILSMIHAAAMFIIISVMLMLPNIRMIVTAPENAAG